MQTTSKDKALERLAAIEAETKELRKIIQAPDKKISVFDRINTIQDACEDQGLIYEEEIAFKTPKNNRQRATNAFNFAQIVVDSLLDGVVLDFTNGSQNKYYVWGTDYKSGSGFRFGEYGFGWSNAAYGGGARLYVDTLEKAKHFAAKFAPLLNEINNPIR